MVLKPTTATTTANMPQVDLLILGAGWTSTFLIPLLQHRTISYAATSTTGRDGTTKFVFDPASTDPAPYKNLPSARTVLITFPLRGAGQSERLTSLYRSIHGGGNGWIQLGSTGIFTGEKWNDAAAPYDRANERAIAEDELMRVVGGCVLNLAGLYGGERDPRGWVSRVATSKEGVRAKKALHLVHGEDVARAVVAVHERFTGGTRWLVNDLHVYDWWELMASWWREAQERAVERLGREAADGLDYLGWVGELMVEEGVRALPRGPETLGRVLDGRAFWKEMGTMPVRGRVNDNLTRSA